MLEQDYLMRLIYQLGAAMRRSWEVSKNKEDPEDAANMLEAAIGVATDMDANILLSLAPESIAQIMNVSGVDPKVTEYIARSMLLEASYLDDASNTQLADLRRGQARAIATAYGFSLPEGSYDPESLLVDSDADGNLYTPENDVL